MKKPKAYSYIRFSTPEQAKGHSEQRQRERCAAYCLAHGLELAAEAEYTFFDRGRSAFSGDHVGDNGQLAKLLQMVREGHIEEGSYLIVEDLDRLSREHVFEALPRFIALLKAGIKLVTLKDQKLYEGEPNVMEIMYSIMEMGRAHSESLTKSERLGAVWRKKKEDARTSGKPIGKAVPLWLHYSAETDAYQLHQGRAKVVRSIFQMAIDGYGKNLIAKKLNEAGVPSFKGGSWGASSVAKILSNASVLGQYQPFSSLRGSRREPAGPPVEGYFPAVIDSATFYAAKAEIEARKIHKATKQTVRANVWQGVAKCAACGNPMHVVNKGVPPKGHKYLHCANARKGTCSAKVVRLDQAELVLPEILSKVDSLALVRDSSAKISKDLAEVEGRLVAERKNLDGYISGLRKFYSDSLANLLAACEAGINELELRKSELQTALAGESIIDKADFFSRLDLESREGRSRANSLLKRLQIDVGIKRSESTKATYYLVRRAGVLQIGYAVTGVTAIPLPFTAEQLEKLASQDFKDNPRLARVVTTLAQPVIKVDGASGSG